MENQVKTSTENKEQQLKKLSKMTMIRSLLPIAGLIIIFLMFSPDEFPDDEQPSSGTFPGVCYHDFSNRRILYHDDGRSGFFPGFHPRYCIDCCLHGFQDQHSTGDCGRYRGWCSDRRHQRINFYVYRKIKSFIVTICTMFLFRGFIKYLTTNAPVAGSAMLINFDSTELKLACTLVVLIIGFILFRFTKFGTYLKAIGAGEKAAMFSGIRTDRMKFLIYTLAGAITGFAAFINVIKVGSVTSSGGNQLETQILIALVLGGMPISGGAKVRFENIIVGSLLYIVLNSGLTMMGFTTQMMQLIQGVVFLIFVAVFADRQSLQVIK